MKISNEFKVGLLALVAIAVLYVGFNYLKGTSVFEDQKRYFVKYDNVQGLVASGPVHYNGLTVGIVESLHLDNNTGEIICQIIVDSNVKLGRKSVAEIYSTGFISDKAVKLIPNASAYNRGLIPDSDIAMSGDTLVGNFEIDITTAVAAEVAPVRQKAEEMMSSIDSILNVIKGVFDEKTQDNITNSIGSIETTLGNFKVTTYKLNDLIDSERQRLNNIFTNIESISTNLLETNKQINDILAMNTNKVSSIMTNADLTVQNVNDLMTSVDVAMGNINTITENVAALELQKTINSAEGAISDINKLLLQINSGEGTLGMLINDDRLYNNLNSTSRDLDQLLVDLKENPKKYVQFSLIERKKKDKEDGYKSEP